jgi:arginase family enzyme
LGLRHGRARDAVPELLRFQRRPQPLGLDWDELVALVRPLAAAPNLVGASVADFNPDRDPDGAHARRVVEALRSTFRR